MTKDLLKGDPPNSAVGSAFDSYISQCISHFKLIDTGDNLQASYPPTEVETTDGATIAEYECPDSLLFHHKEKPSTLDNFVVTSGGEAVERHLPTTKHVELYSEELRTKGVRKPKKKVPRPSDAVM